MDELQGKQARQLAALEQLNRLRNEIERKYGVCEGDLLAEVREERMQDMERVWRGES